MLTRTSRTARSRSSTTASSRTTKRCASASRPPGYVFNTQTDTEVIAHLVHSHWHAAGGGDLLRAVRAAVAEFHGAYAIAVISTREPGRVVGARAGSPLVVGLGDGDHFLASDASALLSVTRRVVYLEEGDVADVRRESYAIHDAHGVKMDRAVVTVEASGDAVELGPYRHFMQKEIFEQPRAVADTLESVGAIDPNVFGAKALDIFSKVDRVLVLACGTSYYSSLVAKQWIESLAGIPCQVEIASEYRYRDRCPVSIGARRRRIAVGRDRRHARRAEARAIAGPAAHACHL
jgi:glucosamine--fructose-6-phosphate aminotransferase (isomerizing)